MCVCMLRRSGGMRGTSEVCVLLTGGAHFTTSSSSTSYTSRMIFGVIFTFDRSIGAVAERTTPALSSTSTGNEMFFVMIERLLTNRKQSEQRW